MVNPITAIIGSKVGDIADPGLDRLKQLVIGECLAVAATEGITFKENFIREINETFSGSPNMVSMLQDIVRGRETEIDYMNGGIASLGSERGIACPVNAALTSIIKAMEHKGFSHATWK